TTVKMHNDDHKHVDKIADSKGSSSTAETQTSKNRFQLSKDAIENLYYKMVEEVTDYAILLLDTDGNILNWNKGAAAIKGYSADEIVGVNFRVFYPDEDRKAKVPERLLNDASITGRATHEGWRLKKDGTKFWGSIAITA